MKNSWLYKDTFLSEKHCTYFRKIFLHMIKFVSVLVVLCSRHYTVTVGNEQNDNH